MEARVAALEQGLVAVASVSMISALELEKKGFRVLAWASDMARGFSLTGEPNPGGMRVVLEQVKREMGITKELSISRVADFSLLREFQKELGVVR